MLFCVVQIRLAAGVRDMCQGEINKPDPDVGGFTAINELVVDQMRRLGLAHFIDMPTVACPNDPMPRSSLFKRPATPASSDGEDQPQGKEELPIVGDDYPTHQHVG